MTDTVQSLLTVDALARRLNVSRASIYRRIEDGLPFLKIGGCTRFDEAAVLAWCRERQDSPAQDPEPDPLLPAGDYACRCGYTAHVPRAFRRSELTTPCPECGRVGAIRAAP